MSPSSTPPSDHTASEPPSESGALGFERMLSEALRLQSSDLPRAIDLARECYAIASRGEPSELARSAIMLGSLFRMRGLYEDAERLLCEGLEHAPTKGIRLSGLIQLGQAYLEQGNHDEAIAEFAYALGSITGDEYPEKLAAIHVNLGNAYAEIDSDRALSHYSHALKAYSKIGDEAGIATVQANIGIRAQHLGRHEDAILSFSAALRLLHSLGEERLRGIVLQRSARSHLALGQYVIALNECEASLGIASDQQILSLRALSLFTKADVLEALGDAEGSHDLREESEALRINLRQAPFIG